MAMARRPKDIGEKVLSFVKQLSVEPLLLCSWLAFNINQVVQQVGIYRTICIQTYGDTDDGIDCRHLANATTSDGHPAELEVQRRAAMFSMANGIATMGPAIVADILLGAYGDRHGRKVNMLAGMTGSMVSMLATIVLFTFPRSIPIYALVAVNALVTLGGGHSIVMISSSAYLADTVLDAATLTVRMSVLTVIMSLATIVGSLIASAVSRLSSAQGIVIAQSMTMAAFSICMIRVKQVPPAELKRRTAAKRAKSRDSETNGPEFGTSDSRMKDVNGLSQPTVKEATVDRTAINHPDPPSTPAVIAEIMATADSPPEPSMVTTITSVVSQRPPETTASSSCATALELLRETWHTYSRPRPGHGRLYLLVAALVFFLNTVSEGVRLSIVPLFVQKAPLGWDQSMIGYYRSSHGVSTMIGTTVGVLVFKKLLRFPDTLILAVATAAHLAEFLLMAFATRTWIVFATHVVSLPALLVLPCVQSFMAQQVAPNEVGKAFTAFGIAANIGFLISNAIYSPIYSATLVFMPGFVFLFAAAITALALGAVVWLHCDIYCKDAPKCCIKGGRASRKSSSDQETKDEKKGKE